MLTKAGSPDCTRCSHIALLAGVAALVNASAGAEEYPYKPIRVVASSAGGSGDLAARLLAQGISGPLGQAVIVDNRGSGMIAGPLVARANPDGYTLLSIGNSLWLATLLQSNIPYDPVRDFAPVSLTHKVPHVLVVHPSLPVKTIAELIAYAKSRPGQLNYASGSNGSAPQLAAELFKSMAGINIVGISYKGGGATINALLSGEIQLSFASAPAVMPQAKTGKLRALAVTSAQPSALTPGLATVAASGLPGYESEVTSGVMAPAKTPAVVIARLNREIVRFLSSPEAKDRLLNARLEAAPSSPQEFAAAMTAELKRMRKVVADAHIRAE